MRLKLEGKEGLPGLTPREAAGRPSVSRPLLPWQMGPGTVMCGWGGRGHPRPGDICPCVNGSQLKKAGGLTGAFRVWSRGAQRMHVIQEGPTEMGGQRGPRAAREHGLWC